MRSCWENNPRPRIFFDRSRSQDVVFVFDRTLIPIAPPHVFTVTSEIFHFIDLDSDLLLRSLDGCLRCPCVTVCNAVKALPFEGTAAASMVIRTAEMLQSAIPSKTEGYVGNLYVFCLAR